MKRFILALILMIGAHIWGYTSDDIVPNTMIVKLDRSGLSAMSADDKLDNVNAQFGILSSKALPIRSRSVGLSAQSHKADTYILETSDHADVQELVAYYSKLSWVSYAEPVYKVTLYGVNDTEYEKQTYLHQTSLNDFMYWPTTEDVVVAVVDTGVDHTHPDLINQLFVNEEEIENNGIDDDGNGYVDDRYGYNFYGATRGEDTANARDVHGHGTHLSGIIAAESNNNMGISGINSSAKILNVSFLNASGAGNQIDAALAIRYAVDQGADVINCSWGYKYSNTTLREAMDYAVANDVLVIAASGNDGSSSKDYPAAYSGVLSIGSVDDALEYSYFSNYGSHLDYTTFGESIYSLAPGGGYTTMTGTSQAAAIMSGIASRVIGRYGKMSPEVVSAILTESSSDLGDQGYDVLYGNGLVTAGNILRTLSEGVESIAEQAEDNFGEGANSASTSTTIASVESFSLSGVMNFPNPASGQETTFSFISEETGSATIKIYNLNGQLEKQLDTSMSSGYSVIPWDTSDENGDVLPNGTYMYNVSASTDDGQQYTQTKLLTILN